MSRKIRLGNDVPIEWNLLDEGGNPYILSGRDFRVELLVGSRKFPIAEATASGNTIRFTYFGKDQRTTGKVNLIYIENEGRPDMVTYDTEDAFTMVSHSWQAVDEDELPETVTTESVVLTSTLSTTPSFPMKRGSGENSAQQDGSGADASGDNSFAEGDGVSSGDYSHAEGFGTESFGDCSHAEGENTTADGECSHAEGNSTQATEQNTHAEGWQTIASGANSHAEGRQTLSSGNASHAEGRSTQATEQNAHAEGYQSVASGMNSHAEGFSTQAGGHSAHSEGRQAIASANYSHAEGRGTEATHTDGEHAQGVFNASHENTIHSIGIGSSANDRKNAVEVLKNGFAYFLGVGGYNGTNPTQADSLAEVLASFVTKQEVADAMDGTVRLSDLLLTFELKEEDAIVKEYNDTSEDGCGTIVWYPENENIERIFQLAKCGIIAPEINIATAELRTMYFLPNCELRGGFGALYEGYFDEVNDEYELSYVVFLIANPSLVTESQREYMGHWDDYGLSDSSSNPVCVVLLHSPYVGNRQPGPPPPPPPDDEPPQEAPPEG